MSAGTFDFLGMLGAVTGTSALGWQVWTWKRGGHHVEVTATNVFPVYGDRMGDHHLGVIATNKGRLAVDLTAWGVELPNGASMFAQRAVIGGLAPALPHRLEPGSQATFHMEAAEVRAGAQTQGAALKQLRAWVALGDGTREYTHKPLPLA